MVKQWYKLHNSKKRANPSFPYLENKLAELSDTHTMSMTVLRMAKELK